MSNVAGIHAERVLRPIAAQLREGLCGLTPIQYQPALATSWASFWLAMRMAQAALSWPSIGLLIALPVPACARASLVCRLVGCPFRDLSWTTRPPP